MQEKGRQAEFDPITEMEISSILDSGLPSHEKSALLASYFSEDNTSGSSSGITVQEKTNHKKADTKSNAPPEEIKNKASCSSSGVELQEKNKHRDEANAKEEHNSDKEPELKESSLSHPSSEQGKGKHMGAMAKEKDNDHLLCKDEKSEVQDDDKSLSHPTSQQIKAKTKGALDDPLTNEEISSILHSTLSKKDKLSLLILSNLNGVENSPLETKTSTSTTPLKVEVKEKVQHNETEVKRDVEDHLPSDDRKIDERLSHSSPRQEEQAKVYPNFKLTSDEKSQPLVYDRTEVDVRWSKLSSSSTSSRNEFKVRCFCPVTNLCTILVINYYTITT
ncbi:uncharacterized protein LOC105180019 isoform X1 [Sesamum indicum]|uniref:Uncharacterized protein LOC105180019 isoform X1 n=1 Tax=Sesamum indicum TaxID=4182 RepID=A0A8M8UTA2_SESIN|nr:uncharacterized protein LOC105180019 isoform X1 [Sesamum indicum]